ncbi:hypothetical protein E2C01_034326 [Portunus trituberculatus]|uniref:Uncharacterized protein n=1 Tax=Portunus trituberculatus TaxID=210409 RepID=A0A5B7F0D8_PORTR|nr:hypothetical protein [Portunus trituberculatus]
MSNAPPESTDTHTQKPSPGGGVFMALTLHPRPLHACLALPPSLKCTHTPHTLRCYQAHTHRCHEQSSAAKEQTPRYRGRPICICGASSPCGTLQRLSGTVDGLRVTCGVM